MSTFLRVFFTVGDVIDLKTGKTLFVDDSSSRLESALKTAISDDNRSEISRLSQLLHSIEKEHPLALSGLALHNMYLGDFQEAATCADAAVNYSKAGKMAVIAKLDVIYHGIGKGAYELDEAMEFMYRTLKQYECDIDVIDSLFNISVEVLSDKEFAEIVLVEAIKVRKTASNHSGGSVKDVKQTLILYSSIKQDSE